MSATILKIVHFIPLISGSVADHGCWKAIQREENFVTLESTDGRVKDIYKGRNDSLLKCAEAAISQQYTLFALRDGGQCSAGNLKSTGYKKHGVSKLCTNGLGSASSKNVYQIIGICLLDFARPATLSLDIRKVGTWKTKFVVHWK